MQVLGPEGASVGSSKEGGGDRILVRGGGGRGGGGRQVAGGRGGEGAGSWSGGGGVGHGAFFVFALFLNCKKEAVSAIELRRGLWGLLRYQPPRGVAGRL